jgi:amino acid adenylation domain-containing protein/non-ribosomal peptide synthase protein (TIGR01720 family)
VRTVLVQHVSISGSSISFYARFDREKFRILRFAFYLLLDFFLASCSARFLVNSYSPVASEIAPEIIDLYELTPMQQGMLFHTLHNTIAAAYFEQRHCVIAGDLNEGAFHQAWQLAVDRHPVLRTGFYWQEAEKPLQVVYDRVVLPWEQQDWQHLSKVEQQQQLGKLLAADRAQGFDLQAPPLMRCYLIQLAPQRWQFIWSHHHLLMDGWCNGILLQQVLSDYDALRQDEFITIAEAPAATYQDYITWLQQQDQTAAKSYWKRVLVDVESHILAKPVAAGEKVEIAHASLQFDPSLSQSLQQFARTHRLTLGTVFQGALALLLGQYSDRDDVVFGLTVAGRPSAIPGVQQTIGLFINTLPVGIRLDPDQALIEWLQVIQAAQLERDRYSYSALAEIQAWVGCPAGTGLFDCLLVIENYPVSMDDLLSRVSDRLRSELTISQPQSFAATNYPLVVTVLPGETIQLAIEYHAEKFLPSQIETLLETLKLYLQQFPESAHQPLRQITTESKQHNYEALQTTLINPNPLAAFENYAATSPNRAALVHERGHLTYQTLNQKANQLAHALQEFGIQPNDRIALCYDRAAQQIIAILAVLKIGAAYVPIDAALPVDRIQYLLQDSQPRLLLGDRASLAQVKSVSVTTWETPDVSNYPVTNLSTSASGEDLAYIIYTSGTTGKPKGVMIERSALAYFTTAAIQTYGFQSDDRVLQFASISFDAAVEEIFPTLAIGATLVLRSAVVPMAADLWQQCRTQAITILDLPTAYWQQLIQQSQPQDIPPTLRMMIIGGEAVDASAVQLWAQFNQPQIQVWNGYGPTEATVVATVGRLQANGAIGQPLTGKFVQILDRWQRPVPVGIVGEIYIGGQGLAKGYWQRPDLTAQKFVQIAAERYYRTGDRGCWHTDRQIIYQGRTDSQIKLRGFRIELEEIAEQLRQQPQVIQATVILEDHDVPQILAYYTGNARVEQLYQALLQVLPAYMMPTAIVPLAEMPLTALGKLDRQALPRPTVPTPAITKPRSPMEASLIEIWQEVLGRSPIGIHDNFFELGGHSLLAMRLVSRMQQALDLSIGFTDLFTYPTIAQITKLKHSEALLISRVHRQSLLPLSFEQQRLWVLQQLDPDDAAYNVSAVLQINGELDLGILHYSFLKLLDRQEILRSAIVSEAGTPYLKISTVGELGLQELPLVEMSTASTQLDPLIQQLVQKPFDLSLAPLWRLQIIQQALQQHVLVLVMHHAVTDGWSIDILAKEWATLYQAELMNAVSDLPALPIQYADYAAWQRSATQHWQPLQDYWQQQLQDLPATIDLPNDRASQSTTVRSAAGKRSTPFLIPHKIMAELQDLSQAQNSTLFMTMLASFGLFLHRLTSHVDNSDRLVIGTPIANRRSRQLDSLIGFFANMLPIRFNFAAMSFETLLQQVRQTCLAAYDHQDLPFEKIVEVIGGDRNLEHHPIFQVAFVFDQFSFGAAQSEFRVNDLCWQSIPTEPINAKFDLTLMLTSTDAGLQGQWEYRRDLFTTDTIEQWSEIFQQLLQEIGQNPEAEITQYNLLSPTDRQLLHQWNQTTQPYDTDGIIAIFQRQVQQSPAAIALVSADLQLTYAELDRQSQQLAHALIQQGIRAEQPVAFQMSRSWQAVLVMLAILKVGAFYLPIDADNPSDRIQTILAESQTQWCIVESPAQIPAIQDLAIEYLHWQDLATASAIQSFEAITLDVNAESLAYIMYTSGSTGVPKGVAIPQNGVLRLVQSCQFAQLDRHTRLLQSASLAFDAATFEVWGALLNGGTLIVLPQDDSGFLNLDELLQTTIKQQVNTLWLTAGLFHQLVEELDYQNRWQDLESVTQLLAGGDVLQSAAITKLKQACPKIRLINGYGPTENTTFTCCHTVEANDLNQISPPIGRPIQNTQVAVLDANQQILPIGLPGELFIQGVGLAQGYWQRSELTATAFIDHPELGRMYRTGDLVKWNRSGNLIYLGRCDRQVKLRGFRVELEEISHAISQHPGIAQAYVDLQHENYPAPTLVAYCVLASGEIWDEPLQQQLQQQLQNQLPRYMQPQHWCPLPQLPLNRNGKVDRHQLPPIVAIQSSIASRSHTAIEQQLCEIWQSILRIETVGIHDNFFALGGDSILAIQMVSRAQSCGMQIKPTQLFQNQTIAELAAALQDIDIGLGSTSGQSWAGTVELTPIQQCFFQQHGDRPNYFNQSVVLEATEPLDISRLKTAWSQLLQRHDILRSRFWRSIETQSPHNDLSWQQEVMTIGDYRHWDSSFHVFSENDDSFVDRVNQLQASLDLSTGKLCQVAYFQNSSQPDSNQPSRLVLIIHHLVIDALSWRILLEDLRYDYDHGNTANLLHPKYSYRDWANHLQSMARSPEVLESLPYWRSQTQFVMPLPDYQSTGSNQVQDTVTQHIALTSTQTSNLLQQTNSAYSTQVQEILVAAIAKGLAAWTDCDQVRFDLESHGRDATEIETFSLVGWFTSLFPVVLTIPNSDREAIITTKELLRRLPHKGLSYGLLRYASMLESPLASDPNSQICFNYLGQVEADSSLGFQLQSVPTIANQDPLHQRSYAIEITAMIQSAMLQIEFSYSRHQFTQTNMQKLAQRCQTALIQIIDHCLSQNDVMYSPTDFGLVDLQQTDLDQILAAVTFEAALEPGGMR